MKYFAVIWVLAGIAFVIEVILLVRFTQGKI